VSWPRPARILAIARRDLAHELKGRQGLLLPGIVVGLLLPASTVPSPAARMADPLADIRVSVHGEVPDGVAEADGVVPPNQAPIHLRFRRQGEVLLVDGPVVPPGVRAVLDDGDPVVVLDHTPRGYALPGRTALLSLISASTLTGAVSGSIGGERSRRTLGVLLAAAITRTEIVLGKWLAWGGFGAAAALLGAVVAIVTGNVAPGWWLIPLPTVPLATVALGLWLVRRASDVMAGSATALRVLPAALSILGVLSWVLGDSAPWLGALVPLGGGLLAAGDMWLGPWLPLLAAASTLGCAGLMLAATIRDLDEVPDRSLSTDRSVIALAAGSVAALGWWMPVGAPALWAAAGNPRIVEGLEPSAGVLAGTAVFALLSLAVALRSTERAWEALALGRPTLRGAALGAVAGLALAAIAWAALEVPPLVDGTFRDRLVAAVQPPWPVLALAAIVAQEVVFRGWLTRRAGALRAGVVWAVVVTPLDPLLGLGTGAVCGWLAARTGSPLAPIVARAVWWAVAAVAAGWP
jgi:hypothetical protein